MKFRKDNKIPYMQDFSFYVGIPSGVDFKLELAGYGNNYKLTSFGYGDFSGEEGAYGNGSLFVDVLTARQLKRFERHLAESKCELNKA